MTAMMREDTIRAAEKGDPAAVATITSWAGPDHAHGGVLDQIVALARRSNAQLKNTAHAARMEQITADQATNALTSTT